MRNYHMDNEKKEMCPICEDTLWLLDDLSPKDPYTNKYKVIQCDCVKKDNTKDDIKLKNLIDLETFKPKNQNQITAMNFAKDFVIAQIKDLFIAGESRTGKTTLCNAIENSLQLHGIESRFILYMDTEKFSNDTTFNIKIGEDQSKVKENINFYKDVKNLIFELDNYPSKMNDYFKDNFTSIIAARVKNPNKKTVISSVNEDVLKKVGNRFYKIIEQDFDQVRMDF